MICIRLFDLHCDTLTIGCDSQCAINENNGAVDLRRGRAFAPWVQAFATFIPDDLRGEDAERYCNAMLDTAERWERQNLNDFRIVRCSQDFTHDNGSCRALLTGENIGAIGDITVLNRLRARRMCVATLTWNGDNPWGSGCFGGNDGLTSLGVRAVKRMQNLGIVVDVSHINAEGFWDIARQAKHPFIASHSNSASITPHPRNLTDEQFQAVRDNGGIVGVNLYHAHLGIPFDGDYFDAFYRHLSYYLSLNGENAVCIGTDFDGMELPSTFDGMGVLVRLYNYLLARGIDAALLDKVFYTNAYRFFSKQIA